MKKLILFVIILMIRLNTVNSQILYSPNTYYVIPPTTGCDGVWAIQDPDLTCSGIWSVPSPTCYTISHYSGDTLFLNLCSLPCDFTIMGTFDVCMITYFCMYNVCNINASGIDLSCSGTCDGSAIADGIVGNNPYTVIWSNGSSGNSISNLCPGTYTVTLTDATNCTVSDEITISQPSPPIINQVITNPSCQTCTDGIAEIIVTGGSGNYSYQWCDGSNTSATYIGYGCCSFSVTDLTTGCVISDSACVTYMVGTGESPIAEFVQIYPNPAEDLLHVTLSIPFLTLQDKGTIKLYDIHGKSILSNNITGTENTIHLQNLSPGLYTIIIEINEKIIYKKTAKR